VLVGDEGLREILGKGLVRVREPVKAEEGNQSLTFMLS
jgi:hypothetical protein